MMRTRLRSNQNGLTLVEVLVSVAVLGIVAAALLATVSVIVRLNREAAVEVDYSRVVRTAVERIRLDWQQLPNAWTAQTVATEPLDDYVRARSDNACGAVVVSEVDGVRVVRITCAGDDVPDQVYHVEFGEP